MIAQQQLQKWRRLADAATPGEWWTELRFVFAQDGEMVAAGEGLSDDKIANAAFIAAAREAVPALLDEVARLRAELESTPQGLVALAKAYDARAATKPQPSAEENDAAAERVWRIENLYTLHGNDKDTWPAWALEALERLQAQQDAYEAQFC
jgi:hypothetical protein